MARRYRREWEKQKQRYKIRRAFDRKYRADMKLTAWEDEKYTS